VLLRDRVCLRNICINTLHKGDSDDDNNNNNTTRGGTRTRDRPDVTRQGRHRINLNADKRNGDMSGYMEQVRFEPTMSVLEQQKTVHSPRATVYRVDIFTAACP
jgi:hypothetical protein